MTKKEELTVMRARKDYRDRLVHLANKRKQTLTAITNEALEKFLIEQEYTFDDLLKVIDTIPSLKVSIDKIKSEIPIECPALICKQIIETIKDKQVFLFEESLDTLVDRIENLNKINLYGVFIHITTKGEQLNKVNEILKKITEILKNKIINLGAIGAGMKGNDHDKVLLFVSYNKKEGDGDGKK